VNYACHPVILGPDNLEYSADWPGVMTRTVEQGLAESGAKPVCFFLQGGDGDINPYYAVTPLKEDAVGRRDWSGERAGEEAARVAQAIRTEAPSEPSLDYAEDVLSVPLRWDAEGFRQGLDASFGPEISHKYFPHIDKDVRLPVTTVLVDRQIALMTMPGEPFVDFQKNWRDRCPVSTALFLAYTNGYYGYFPTIRASTLGGYGADTVTTWVEPGAGERMVDDAVVRTYKMLGRLRSMPSDLPWKK